MSLYTDIIAIVNAFDQGKDLEILQDNGKWAPVVGSLASYSVDKLTKMRIAIPNDPANISGFLGFVKNTDADNWKGPALITNYDAIKGYKALGNWYLLARVATKTELKPLTGDYA